VASWRIILPFHVAMLRDTVRVEAYAAALRAAVRPETVVLDLGTGTGILAALACRAGAKRVHAVEVSPVLHIARQMARANGFEERIHFIAGKSTEIALDEPADLLVTEILGDGGLDEGILEYVADARRRLVKPGGRLIPEAVRLSAVPLDEQARLTEAFGVWRRDLHGIDYASVRPFVSKLPVGQDLRAEQFLADPAPLLSVDLRTHETTFAAGSARFRSRRDGLLGGIGIWFAADLGGSIELSNAPGGGTTSWGQLVLPIDPPVRTAAGDDIRVEIATNNGTTWRWRGSAGGQTFDASNVEHVLAGAAPPA
jgi:precorrin-6B methylase 2